MGVISALNGHLGEHAELFAVFGALCVALMVFKFTCTLWDGVKTYVLLGPLGLSVDLKRMGEWAVVTGSTDGIGKAYAEELAKLGLNIVLISRSKDKLDTVASEIVAKYKVKTKCIVADFTAGVENCDLIKQGLAGMEIGVLVNNVGMSYRIPEFFAELDRDEACNNFLNVNSHSVVMMTYIVLPQMVRRRRGVIINNASASALTPTPLLTVYSATKAFMDFFSRGLEQEYKSRGIVVQTLMPFLVSTKMTTLPPNLLMPSASAYVQSAIKTIGLQGRTFGCISHACQAFALSFIPEWLVNKMKFSGLLLGRKQAFEQMQKEAQMKTE